MPNAGQGSPLFRRPRGRVLWAIALAGALALAGCWSPLPALPAFVGVEATVKAVPPGDETLESFTQRLAGALLEGDSTVLAAMMAAEFRMAEWQGQGRLLMPEEAAAEVVDVHLGEGAAPAFSLGVDVAARLGRDPLTMWQPAVNAVATLYLTGLAGGGDAVLVVAQAGPGRYQWAGMLYGPAGFAQAESMGLPLQLDILRAVEVYTGPEGGAAEVGVLNAGQTVDVLGAAADGAWWQIQCPFGVAGECWVEDDPAAMRRVEAPPPAASPTATPTHTASATPLPLPTPVPPTATPVPPSPTPVPPSPTPVPPSPTPVPPLPTPLPTVAPERIRFGPGEVAATRQGTLGPQQRKQYVLGVQAGQTLNIEIGAPDNAANFAVTGLSDGQPYKRLENEDRTWSMVVPRTQDYLVTVAALEQTPYTLYIYIPPPAPTPTATEKPPQRVTFGAGQTAAVLNGQLAPGALDRYLLRAVGGQTMYVSLTSDTGAATFGVYGYQDGAVLKRYEVRGDTWSGVLPSSQDYLVTVLNGGTSTVRYSLAVSFSPLGSLPPTPAPAERIRFDPGAVSATVYGTVVPGGARAYVLGARGGQTMEVFADAAPGSVILGIRGANGARLLDPAAGRSSASVLLTTTQDYTVTVYSTGAAADFALTVAIY